MKYLFYLIVFVFLSMIVYSQGIPPSIQWQKSLGGNLVDKASDISQTPDGGYIIAGYSSSPSTYKGGPGQPEKTTDVIGNHGYEDYWIVKINSTGDTLWEKSFGGSGSDIATSMQQTADGGYIIAGFSSSNDGNVGGNHGGNDYWIVKLDSSGNLQWQKSYGGSSDDEAQSIQQTKDGGYIIAGWTESNNGDVTNNHGGNFPSDYWIVKINSIGNLEWQKCLGGSGYDVANSIKQTTDGGYIIAGYDGSADGDVTKNIGLYDYWIVKLTNSGALQWQKSYGGTGPDYAQNIIQTTDNGYIIAGVSNSIDSDAVGNNYGYWILKIDSIGNIQWQKSFGNDSYGGQANSIKQTKDGGYIAAGWFSEYSVDYYVVKMDSLGNKQWEKYMGGSNQEEAQSIEQTKDGGYIIAGWTESNNGDATFNWGGPDFWIVKLAMDSINTYNFTGTGNWSNPSNWSNNTVPLVTMPSGTQIIISPSSGGQCILDIPVTIPQGVTLTVNTGAKFLINGNLIILQ